MGLLIGERGQPAFDAEPVPEATLADLDGEALGRLLARVRQRQPAAFAGVEDQVALQRLRVVVRQGDRLVPSLGGLMALGVYPQQFFPQLHLSFVSIPSTSKDQIPAEGPRFLDNQTITGSIPIMVAETLRVITRNMSTRGTITGGGVRKLTSIRWKRSARRSSTPFYIATIRLVPVARRSRLRCFRTVLSSETLAASLARSRKRISVGRASLRREMATSLAFLQRQPCPAETDWWQRTAAAGFPPCSRRCVALVLLRQYSLTGSAASR